MDLNLKKGALNIATDTYTKGFLSAVKKAQTDNELINIIDKIYEDGFEDGYSEGKNDDNSDNKNKDSSNT